MNSHLFAAILTLGILSSASAVANDALQGTRSPDDVLQTEHTAEISLRPGSARIVVRRTFHNRGPETDQAVLQIESPPGAVAVRLRTRGFQGGQPVWFEGELMDRDEAEARYRELTGVGMAIPKDPALLYWVGPRALGLQVFPILSNQDKTIEYTFVAPTSYSEGRYRVALGPMVTGLQAANARLRAEVSGALFVGDERHAPGTRLASFALDGEVTEASFERAGAPQLDGAMAVVPVSAQRSLLRYRFEAAPRLSSVPRGAAVAVLLDESRSLSDDDVRAAREVAAEYLSHFVDARVAIIPFDRSAHPVAPSLVTGAEAVRLLSARPVVRRNGSNLDAALERAASLLSRAPTGADRRVLVLTDTRMRDALSLERLRRALSSTSALTHVAVASVGSLALEVDDEHDWRGPVRATGGMVWNASVDEAINPADRAEVRSVLEELARPVRLHHLRLEGSGFDLRAVGDAPFDLPDELPEATGIEALRLIGGAPTRLALHGELWTRPIRKVLAPSDAEGRLAAALAFGTEILWELTEAEQRTLAFRGRAVTPVTSYLAIEPGVRPSVDGLDEAEGIGGLGLSGIGHGGGGAGVGIGLGAVRSNAAIVAELRRRWNECGGHGAASLDLETTFSETVDVLHATAQSAGEQTLLPCWIESAWGYELGPEVHLDHDVIHIEV